MATKKKDRREIFKDLKSNEVAPLYYLHGADAFMLQTAIDAVIAAALPEGANDMNFQKFRGRDATSEAILTAAETLPFLTRRRVVLVQEAQTIPLPDLDALKDYFANPAPTTVMIIAAITASKKLDGRSAAVKALRKAAQEYVFDEFREYEIGPVIERNAKKFGLSLDRTAVAYLIEAIGTDMGLLVGALQTIDLYLGPEQRSATADDVREIISDTRVKSVFDLVGAVGGRNVADSLKILDRMLTTGESAIGVTAMFARHFRIVGRFHDPSIARLPQRDKAGAVGVSPFFLKEYEADARRFSRLEVEQIRRRLVETDLALKSSRLSDRTVMEGLLLEICTRESA